MRLDHIAYRVRDREKATQFFIDALGYRIGRPFRPYDKMGEEDINYNILCNALLPPERIEGNNKYWQQMTLIPGLKDKEISVEMFHAAPEVFVSDGPKGTIVGDWVEKFGPGVHHIAYQTDDVDGVMEEWKEKGYAEFLSEEPLTCDEDPGLKQVFTKPSELTGVIYEFITRGQHGFCEASVQHLMNSTKVVNEKG